MTHFDISLAPSPGAATPPLPRAGHRVRQTVLHPAPSRGYQSIFGEIPEIRVQDGFSVVRMDYHYPKEISYSFNSTRCPVMFAYVLKGERRFRIAGRSREIVTREGSWYAGYLGESRGSGSITGTPAIRSVKFRFDPLTLYDLLEGRISGLPHGLAFLLRRLEGGLITLGGKMSAAMGAAVNRVMQNPRETEFHRLAFEGDVLDLLVLHLQELHGIGKHNSPAPQCSDETRLARAARDMLMASLAAPPDLKLMASLLGTSAITLKKAFTKVFGASPHKYAGARRMEYAKHLLEKGHMNVNEVSSELGYANTSRFIDAFQRTYGAKPGAYMRGIRRSYMLMAPAQMRAEPSPKRERL